MRRLIILTSIILLLISPKLKGQEIVTLVQCFERAESNHALTSVNENYEAIFNISSQILRTAWYPGADLAGTYIYNSDVIEMGGPFPSMPRDQYKVTAEISQLIYDGGLARESRRYDEAGKVLNQQKNEVEIYRIRERVIATYFAIILLEKQHELLGSFIQTTDARLEAANTAIQNGLLTPADRDILLASKLQMEQQRTGNGILSLSLRQLMGSITGIKITPSTIFVLPEPGPVAESGASSKEEVLLRPELKLYDLTASQLDANEALISTRRLPKARGFATLGYGNPPGSNFFKNSFEPYFIVGASLNWNIFDWNKTKKEREIIALRKEIVSSGKSDTEQNIRRQLDTKLAEIESLRTLIKTGTELLALRERITASVQFKLDNGTMTASDYLAEVNPAHEAAINLEIHRVNLLKAEAEFNYLRGTENK